MWKVVPFLVIFTILSFHFATNFAAVTRRPSPHWSRPIAVDSTTFIGGSVPAVLDSGHTLVFTSQTVGISYTDLAPNGTVVKSGQLNVGEGTHANLQAIGGEAANLFWITNGALMHVVVSQEGQLLAPPVVVAQTVKAFSVRRDLKGLVLFVYDKAQNMAIFRQSGNTWSTVGKAMQIAGTFGSFEAQVLDRGQVVAFVHVEEAEKHHKLVLLRGDDAKGFQSSTTVFEFAIKTKSGNVQPLVFGVDGETGYAFYTVETNEKGSRESAVYMATGPLKGEHDWVNELLGAAGPLGNGIVGGQLINPTLVPGPSGAVRIAFLSQSLGRFSGSLDLVTATYQNGKQTGMELLFHGKSALRPAADANGSNQVITFASYGSGDTQSIVALSSQPAAITQSNHVTSLDVAGSVGDTFFDMVMVYYGIFLAAVWFLPMLGVIALVYLGALTWAERHNVVVFWIGAAVGLVGQIYIGITSFGGEGYANMPGWLGPQAGRFYVAISLLMLLVVWQSKRPGRYQSAVTPLLWWSCMTALQTGMLFGPFLRRG
jgi:hypothetical protein